MSGLEPESATILEIATLVTDADLQTLAEGPDIVVAHDDTVLAAMDPWNTEHHRNSGLVDAVRASTTSLAQAERATLEFLGRHCEPGKSPLCGNSIGRDRRFLRRYMPALAEYLHYRNIDVSTVKEIARRWYPALPEPVKQRAHRARDDIHESIAELRYWRAHVFR